MTEQFAQRILIVHNRYKQVGGEYSVVHDERILLEQHGVSVEYYERHNDEIDGIPRLALAAETVWSFRTFREITAVAGRFQPEVIHAHNTFPLISPSLYYAASQLRLPVVQTLHNFRLFCPQAMFLRDGKVCEDCLGSLPWRGVLHRCYRNSMAQTAVVTSMLGIHRSLGTYRRPVTRYIAMNMFCRNKFVEAGLPADRISIKPNFVDLPAPDEFQERSGALFVGRLSSEKGTAVLARAKAICSNTVVDVIGSGPDQSTLEGLPGIRLLGWQLPAATYARMRGAAYLLMPSIGYENFPRTIVEAFACGLPIIASRIGALAEIIEDGRTGLLFEAGNANDLAQKTAWAEANPAAMREMGRNARREYEAKYTPEINYQQLMNIYSHAISSVRSQADSSA